MPSLRELLDQSERCTFVGRERAVRLFHDLLHKKGKPQNILFVTGMSGVGKSFLLRALRRLAQAQGRAVAMVNLLGHWNDGDPVSVMLDWRWQLGNGSFAEFDEYVGRYKAVLAQLPPILPPRASEQRSNAVTQLSPPSADELARARSELSSALQPDDFEFMADAEGLITRVFASSVNSRASGGRMILMIDAYEQASPEFDAWLRARLIGHLSAEGLLVIAGRTALGPEWSDWQSISLTINLAPFDREETFEYLRLHDIESADFAGAVYDATGGLPLAVAMLVDHAQDEEVGVEEILGSAVARGEITGEIVDRFVLRGLDPEVREMVVVASIAQEFDQDMLRLVLGREVAQDMPRLASLPFCQRGATGFRIHDTVRKFITEELRLRSPQRLRSLGLKVEAASLKDEERRILEGLHPARGSPAHDLAAVLMMIESDLLGALESLSNRNLVRAISEDTTPAETQYVLTEDGRGVLHQFHEWSKQGSD